MNVDSVVRVGVDVTSVPERAVGVGQFLLGLTHELAVHPGVALTVIARTDDTDRWPGNVVNAAPANRGVRLAWEQTALVVLARRLRLDVLHSPHYTHPLAARVPSVITIHDLTFFDHPEWHERKKVPIFRQAIRAAVRFGDVLLCDSEATRDALLRRFQPRGHVEVARLGVDLQRYTPDAQPDDEQLRTKAGLVQPYIAFVGTLEPRKNVPVLVRAFDAIADRHPDLTLAIAGGRGWGADQVDAAVGAAKFGDRIRMLGFIDDDLVAPLLRGAHAVAYPSMAEGFGLPALEALACGVPLVTTKGSVMADIAEGAATEVAPDSVDELAAALDQLVASDAHRAEQRTRGLQVASRHSWRTCADQHVAAYRRAAGFHH